MIIINFSHVTELLQVLYAGKYLFVIKWRIALIFNTCMKIYFHNSSVGSLPLMLSRQKCRMIRPIL